MAAHVVKSPLDLVQGHLGRRLEKPHPLAEDNDLFPVSVQAEGHIIVDVFDHLPQTSKNRRRTQKPRHTASTFADKPPESNKPLLSILYLS